jgi:UPF0755 protein
MTDLSVWADEDQPVRRRRRKKKRDRKGGLAVVISLLVILAVVAGGYALVKGVGSKLTDALSSTAEDYPGPGEGKVVIEVTPGQTVADVGRALKKEDVVASVDAFLAAANAEPRSSSLQPGFYQLKRKMQAGEALALLLDPKSRVQAKVVLPEGFRLDETLKRLADSTKLPLADYQAALKDAQSLGLPAYAKKNAEGFLFPATYDVPPDAKAPDVLKQLFASYARAAEKAGVERTQLEPYEIVIIASLVEAEARHAEDFGKVARVVYNRLDKGMPLQFDSTVNYALKADKKLVTLEDLGTDSPYNTYKNAGLPPGPINSPGERALEAAVNPPDGNWLYFVTVDPESGETKFTGSYQEFLRFKQELKSNQ